MKPRTITPDAIPSLFEIIKTGILKYMNRRLEGFSSKGPDYQSLSAIRNLHRRDSIVAVGVQQIQCNDKTGMCLVRFSVCSRYAGFTRTSVMEYWVTYKSYVRLERSIQKKLLELRRETPAQSYITYPHCIDPNITLLTAIWCANGSNSRNITDGIVTEPPLRRGAPGNGVDR